MVEVGAKFGGDDDGTSGARDRTDFPRPDPPLTGMYRRV